MINTMDPIPIAYGEFLTGKEARQFVDDMRRKKKKLIMRANSILEKHLEESHDKYLWGLNIPALKNLVVALETMECKLSLTKK